MYLHTYLSFKKNLMFLVWCTSIQSTKLSRQQVFLNVCLFRSQYSKDLSMEKITELPKSQGFDSLLVIVDRISKYGHVLPMNYLYIARSAVDLFITEVLWLHGIPQINHYKWLWFYFYDSILAGVVSAHFNKIKDELCKQMLNWNTQPMRRNIFTLFRQPQIWSKRIYFATILDNLAFGLNMLYGLIISNTSVYHVSANTTPF